MVPKLSSGPVAQWPDLQLQSNKHQRNWKFRQLDSLCTAAEETSNSVNLRHALQTCSYLPLHAHLPLSRSHWYIAGPEHLSRINVHVSVLVWVCASCVTATPQPGDLGACMWCVCLACVMWVCVIESMWNMSVSVYPMWKFGCMKASTASRLVAGTRVIVVSHTVKDAGSSSKRVCCCCGEMSWEDLVLADERSREHGGTGTQHGSEWRRSVPQEVAPA